MIAVSPRIISIGLLYVFCGIVSLNAQEAPAVLFEQANKAYGEQRYEDAVLLYDSLLHEGWQSADLSYNAGNAYFKTGQTGKAILYYERTLRQNPKHTDALFNLKQARTRIVDNVSPMPEFALTRWGKVVLDSQSPVQWGYWGIGLLWLAVGAAAVVFFIANVSLRRVAFVGGIVMVILAFVSLGVGWARQGYQQRTTEAIVTAPNAYVKNAPGGQTDLLILHEGIKVEILDEVDGWRKIRLKGAQIGEVVGFIPEERVEII